MSADLLPSITKLRGITQSLAMLDAVLSPEWDYRYYHFDSSWGPGQEMASMRNGSGDDWFLLFDPAGAALKGFNHELAHDASVAQRIQQQVPAAFASFLREPAFSMDQAAYCYWRASNDAGWSKVASPLDNDGSDEMLSCLLAGAHGYQEWAMDYYEEAVESDAVSALFAHVPLNDDLILRLNPDVDPSFGYDQALEIGYPYAKS